MTQERTDRFGFPLLQAGQAQKELTHNEALILVDMLTMASATGIADLPPPAPVAGACWIVGTSPAGEWDGAAGKLALWTVNGWRFADPREGMHVWLASEDAAATWHAGAWVVGEVRARRIIVGGEQVIGGRQPGITVPSGGATIDAEARAGVAAILEALAVHGLIAQE